MTMLRLEIRYFFTALMFFTRIPCPHWVDHDPHYINKSRKYFPLIGWIVGGIAGGLFLATAQILPHSVAVILSMAAGIWVTGAFHEDGFADVCDAFGGGWSKEQILSIMKDSRIGAYGAIGIVFILLTKYLMLIELAAISPMLTALIIFSAHTTSRFVASTFVQTHEYVQDEAKSKSKPIATTLMSKGEILFTVVVTLLTFIVFFNPLFLLLLPAAYIPKIYLGYFFKKHIGGYTGDCLGATQQLSEISFYLSALILCRFM
jgi:adenosylcobinamide-GDP ribazoletransferase